MAFVSSVAIKKEPFWVVADNRAELQLEHRTSLRTMLLSCWSRRMLSNVPHSPPLMFWQLPHRAWHPLGTEDRAVPKPKLAHLTWHERGDTDLVKEKCCRCLNILKLWNLQKLWGRSCFEWYWAVLSSIYMDDSENSLPCQGRLIDWCVWELIFGDRQNLVRLAVMWFFLSVSCYATLTGLSQKSSFRNFMLWQQLLYRSVSWRMNSKQLNIEAWSAHTIYFEYAGMHV